MAAESADQVNRPAARIDHVMVLLDPPAHRDVVASGFLAERFGRRKQKQADSSVAGEYSTLGIAGDSTLIELFGSAMPSASPLVGGIVLSFEEPGSTLAARTLLDEAGQVRYHHQLVLRGVDGAEGQQPWYHLINVDLGTASRLLLFANEVTPEYFSSIGASRQSDGRLCRSDYLDAVLGVPADRSRLLRDISGVTLVVGAERADKIVSALSALGFAATWQATGTELTGPDLVVRLRVDESVPERVGEIEMRISGTDSDDVGTEVPFGSTSKLIIDDIATARWVFDSIA